MFIPEEYEENVIENNEVKKEQSDSSENALRDCSQELAVVQDQLTRLTADFQNYRKRIEKDRITWADRSKIEVLIPLLAVYDNFERALEDAKKVDQEVVFKNWIQGFELIHKTFCEYLVSQKVTFIEQMHTFDPHIHEAIMQVEVPDYRSGDIVTVMQKGFMYKDIVLRTAKVSVAK